MVPTIQPPDVFKNALGLPLVIFALTACGGNPPVQQNTTQTADTQSGSWFCEMGEADQDWTCVQDENLVAKPAPKRLPEPKPQPDPLATDPLREPLRSQALQPVQAEPVAQTQPPASVDVPAEPAPKPASPNVPKHVALAYQPDRPVALKDLPEDFWVVQLVSVSSKENLEAYAVKHQLRGMSAARIWANDQFFYVLILGIYETYANAQEASTDLSAPFDEFPPWIRSVKSLQKAMRTADDMEAQGRG